MNRPKRIIVMGNGPSAYSEGIRSAGICITDETLVFRTNRFTVRKPDPLKYAVTDWFLCEDPADARLVLTAVNLGMPKPRVWLPGIHMHQVADVANNHLGEYDVRLQRMFSQLPAACRWERDPAPYRPLMGSFAIAVAVGMQPEKLILAGHDLFQHPSGDSHAGSSKEDRDWQPAFNRAYLENKHENHRIDGDVKYIRDALSEYQGQVTSIGSVLANTFREEFPDWNWIEG